MTVQANYTVFEPPQELELFLEKGTRFVCRGWGDFSSPRAGEFVFCTAMSGLEEALTDPSFARQVLVTTVSHVGNTGVNYEDMESDKIWAEGLLCRHLSHHPSNWRSKTTLLEWILGNKRFLIDRVDTRTLTEILRDQGSQRGLVFKRGTLGDNQQCLQQMNEIMPSMQGLDLTGLVTCKSSYFYKPAPVNYWPLFSEPMADDRRVRQIAVWDFGVKRNTLNILYRLGYIVHVLPASAKAEEILSAGRDGILLSNGPGDPAAATHIIAELRKVLGRRPIFSICLGHQLLGLALGGKTYKMPYGHRGIHHPVVERDHQGQAKRVWITSQNHGFAVDRESLPSHAFVSFDHADDGSVEGLSVPELSCESVQFHPEAAPGPFDAAVMLKEFFGGLKDL